MLIEFTGTVECFTTSDGASFVYVKSSTTAERELFVLFYASQGGATSVTAMWAAILSAARASGQPVTIKHDDSTSRIGSLTIGAGPFI
jgi:hypothetical protein